MVHHCCNDVGVRRERRWAKDSQEHDLWVLTRPVVNGDEERARCDAADLFLPVVVREHLHVREVEVEGAADESTEQEAESQE